MDAQTASTENQKPASRFDVEYYREVLSENSELSRFLIENYALEKDENMTSGAIELKKLLIRLMEENLNVELV